MSQNSLTTLFIVAGIVFIVVSLVWLFMQGKQFGAKPDAAELKKRAASFHYRNGRFQNLHATPALTEDSGFLKVFKEFFFNKTPNKRPPAPLPSVITNVRALPRDKNLLVWFGHSSYFMILHGRTILVDPVFSGNASPVSFTTKSFAGTDIYSADDFPDIDYLFITHDHWDHLDYKTILAFRPKVKRVITGLGVAAHLELWGYDKRIIEEKDWNERLEAEPGIVIHCLPARHFSGRGFKRNGTAWSSFALITPGKKIYIGGDSGYDDHFSAIGKSLGPFDLAILEDGQYDKNWKYIHMMPEETVQAADDLKATALLPVHWAKFNLSVHPWNDPILRVKQAARQAHMPLVHPRIGELVDLDDIREFDNWWESVH